MSNLEDLFPLSPLQHGMYYHTLLEPGSGVYVEQVCLAIHGPFQQQLFMKAWQTVTDRHPILRTAVQTEGLDYPMQAVRKHILLVCKEVNWEPLAEEERCLNWKRETIEAAREDFDLAKAPLMRLLLARFSEHEHRFAWTFHHLILDGWSSKLVLDEVMDLYEALVSGREVSVLQPPPYREYIAWLEKQDRRDCDAYWRNRFSVFPHSSGLRGVSARSSSTPHSDPSTFSASLCEADTKSITQFSRAQQLTLTTLFQGAWAVVLSQYFGSRSVFFGTVTSGRPSSLSRVESMIGLFINTLPTLVDVPVAGDVLPWLQSIQHNEIRAREFEIFSVSDIVPDEWKSPGKDLFDSVLAFQNYSVSEARRESGGAEFLHLSASEKN